MGNYRLVLEYESVSLVKSEKEARRGASYCQ